MRCTQALAVVGVVAASLASAACSSGAMRAEASAALARDPTREIFGDIERMQFAKTMQVVLPARLTVADVSGDYENEGRSRIASTVEALSEDRSTWSDVNSLFAWTGDPSGTGRFEDLRAEAARQHADLLLVVRRQERAVEETNGLGFLKVLLLPMLFVPTQDVRATFDLRAAVVDVRNGLVCATHDDQVIAEFSSTSAGVDDDRRDAFDAAWEKVRARMRVRVAEKLRGVAGTR